MSIPSECKMPDLSGLSPLIHKLVVQLMVGEAGLSYKAKMYRRDFVRLVDKAIREYRAARDAILAEIEGQDKTYGTAFTDHIETCINAVRRLYNLLDMFNSDGELLEGLRTGLLKDTKAMLKKIKRLRDATEHMDVFIKRGKKLPGKPVMLTISEDDDGTVQVSEHRMRLKELAMVLRNMHEIALHLLKYKKPQSA